MKNAVRIICIALSVCVISSSLDRRVWASERVIEKIGFEQISLTEERVSFRLGGYAPPRVFGLEGERGRLVCDFFDTTIKKGVPRAIPTDGNLVRRIRVGLHTAPKQKIRVVLDLARLFDDDYAVEQHFYENNVFVVIVRIK